MLKKQIEETMRIGAHLYGVEVTVLGRCVEQGGNLGFEIAGTKEVVRLAPLQHKIQWDMKHKREAPMSEAERGAYALLEAFSKKRQGSLVRVVGVLSQEPQETLLTLQVRAFQEVNLSTPSKMVGASSPKRKRRGR